MWHFRNEKSNYLCNLRQLANRPKGFHCASSTDTGINQNQPFLNHILKKLPYNKDVELFKTCDEANFPREFTMSLRKEYQIEEIRSLRVWITGNPQG